MHDLTNSTHNTFECFRRHSGTETAGLKNVARKQNASVSPAQVKVGFIQSGFFCQLTCVA